VRHRPHVQLDEGKQASSIGVGDLDEDIRCDCPLLPTGPVQNGSRASASRSKRTSFTSSGSVVFNAT
jgi:hypothetical protein